MITEADIRDLAEVKTNGAPVTSCYLDIDGRRYVRTADYELQLDALLRRARNGGDTPPSLESDLERIADRVRRGFDRSEVRGVAVFACGDADLFVVHELPVSVRNEITVNAAPSLGQLEVVVQQSEKLAVLAADKQHSRVFVYRLGELIEHTEEEDDVGRDYDTVGVADRGGIAEHREELEHQHLRRAADLLWSVFQSERFEHLVIAAPDAIASELEGDLHPYLRERLRGRLDLPPSASEAAVRAAALQAEREIEDAREAALVADLRDGAGVGERAVVGIEPTLAALGERRVDRLVVSDGFAEPGWHCRACGRLAKVGRACPVCESEMTEVADVVADAVDAALSQSCGVDVCVGNADLDVLGRIGALLRY